MGFLGKVDALRLEGIAVSLEGLMEGRGGHILVVTPEDVLGGDAFPPSEVEDKLHALGVAVAEALGAGTTCHLSSSNMPKPRAASASWYHGQNSWRNYAVIPRLCGFDGRGGNESFAYGRACELAGRMGDWAGPRGPSRLLCGWVDA